MTMRTGFAPVQRRLACLLLALSGGLFALAFYRPLPPALFLLPLSAGLLAVGLASSRHEGDFADWPLLFLLTGTLAFGRAFATLGLIVANLPLYPTEPLIAAGLLLLALRNRSAEWRLPPPLRVALAIYLLLGAGYMALALAGGHRAAALRDAPFCLYAVLLLPALALFRANPGRQAGLLLLGPAAAAALLVAFLRFFVSPPAASAFRAATHEMKMVGLSLSLGLVLLFSLAFRSGAGPRHRRLLLAVAYLALLLLVMAEVRSAWLGVLAALALLVVLQRGAMGAGRLLLAPGAALLLFAGLWRAGLPLLGGLAALAALALLLRGEGRVVSLLLLAVVLSVLLIGVLGLGVQHDKLDSLKGEIAAVAMPSLESTSAANIRWRLGIWRQTAAAIGEFPWFGWGYGAQVDYLVWGKRLSWLKAMGNNSGILPPHNHLLAILHKMGAAGLLPYLFIHGFGFAFGLRRRARLRDDGDRRLLTAALAGLLFWHGVAFFFDTLESPPTSIFQWVLLGLILAVGGRRAANGEPRP